MYIHNIMMAAEAEVAQLLVPDTPSLSNVQVRNLYIYIGLTRRGGSG